MNGLRALTGRSISILRSTVNSRVVVLNCSATAVRGHSDRFHRAARFQGEVHGHVRARLHQDVFLLLPREARKFRGHAVGARLDVIKQIGAVRARFSARGDAGVDVSEGDLRARHRGVRRIRHDPLNFCAIVLGERRHDYQSDQTYTCDQSVLTFPLGGSM